jgi:hypothetical protein
VDQPDESAEQPDAPIDVVVSEIKPARSRASKADLQKVLADRQTKG